MLTFVTELQNVGPVLPSTTVGYASTKVTVDLPTGFDMPAEVKASFEARVQHEAVALLKETGRLEKKERGRSSRNRQFTTGQVERAYKNLKFPRRSLWSLVSKAALWVIDVLVIGVAITMALDGKLWAWVVVAGAISVGVCLMILAEIKKGGTK